MFVLTKEESEALEKKKIYFTFAYIGIARAYKHNQLIWEYHANSFLNEQNVWVFDPDELVEKARGKVDFFMKYGYISQ